MVGKLYVYGLLAGGLLMAAPLAVEVPGVASSAAQAQTCESSVELIKRLQDRRGPPLVVCMDNADANNDGFIDDSEWQAITGGFFSQIDEDGDGRLSTDEIKRLQARPL